ncbi:MAG: hypothetical protein AB7Q27_21410, partial [Acidimicrobiia bacterium]
MTRPSRRQRLLTAAILGIVAGAMFTLTAPTAMAHPLGNLTINTSTGLTVTRDAIEALVVLDLAELPAVQALQDLDSDDSGLTDAERDAAARQRCTALAEGLHLRVDDTSAPWTPTSATFAVLEGQAGLPIIRIECGLSSTAVVRDTGSQVVLEDNNYSDRIGWREMYVVGDDVTIGSLRGASTTSTTALLTQYPTSGSLRQTELTFDAEPGSATATGIASADGSATSVTSPSGVQRRGADGLTARFNDLLAHRALTVPLALGCVALAFLLGAIHSLAPGHGKTMMAAAVVSRRGTSRQILGIGATVAATHTLGVVTIGTV